MRGKPTKVPLLPLWSCLKLVLMSPWCFGWYLLKTTGVVGNAPKMLWTDCPDDDACDKCLDVAFESGNDIACLNEKFPETECILEGNFMNGGSRVFVSSEQCMNGGDMNHIQVTTNYYINLWLILLDSTIVVHFESLNELSKS